MSGNAIGLAGRRAANNGPPTVATAAANAPAFGPTSGEVGRTVSKSARSRKKKYALFRKIWTSVLRPMLGNSTFSSGNLESQLLSLHLLGRHVLLVARPLYLIDRHSRVYAFVLLRCYGKLSPVSLYCNFVCDEKTYMGWHVLLNHRCPRRYL
jgi:hypothetical protein